MRRQRLCHEKYKVALLTRQCVALVRRVVEARNQHASGLQPRFPSLTNPAPPPQLDPQTQHYQRVSEIRRPQTQPGGEAAPAPTVLGYSEKSSRPGSQSAFQSDTAPKKKKRNFMKKLKCF